MFDELGLPIFFIADTFPQHFLEIICAGYEGSFLYVGKIYDWLNVLKYEYNNVLS